LKAIDLQNGPERFECAALRHGRAQRDGGVVGDVIELHAAWVSVGPASLRSFTERLQ
jgi:hypothetical protein